MQQTQSTGSTLDPAAYHLTYRGVIARLADLEPRHGYTIVADLPELTAHDLAALIRHYPDLLLEALAESEATREQIAQCLAAGVSFESIVAAALRTYAGSLVLRDVQLYCERQAELDGIDRLNAAAEDRAAVRQGRLS